MDTKISLNVKKLIELDQKSVALERESEERLKAMEDGFKQEMENITKILQDTKLEAKKIYNELQAKAEQEASALAMEADRRLQEIEQKMTNVIDGLTMELWDRIKHDIK